MDLFDQASHGGRDVGSQRGGHFGNVPQAGDRVRAVGRDRGPDQPGQQLDGTVPLWHPGHPYYFMIPGGQVFTIAPTG